MPRFRRDAAQIRRSGRIEPRTRLLVVCGGEATEPAYFKGLINERRAGHVTVKVKPKGLSPTGLVGHARKLLEQQRDEFDQAWRVTDVDEYPDVSAAVRAPLRGHAATLHRLRGGRATSASTRSELRQDSLGLPRVLRRR